MYDTHGRSGYVEITSTRVDMFTLVANYIVLTMRVL